VTQPRRASTSRYAILGVLSIGPMSGYDVKKLIGRSIAHFWNESYGQIYPILNRLAAEGLAERRREKQRGKPDRHVYSLTAKGRGELERWLAVPARHEPRQQELLETYVAIERRLGEELAGHPQRLFSLVTLHYGQHRCRAMLQWCVESLRDLKRLEKRRGGRRRR